jgi:hypothetical protein
MGKVEGAQSVTGVRAVLAARGVAASGDQVLEVRPAVLRCDIL